LNVTLEKSSGDNNSRKNILDVFPNINYLICADTEGWRHDMDFSVGSLLFGDDPVRGIIKNIGKTDQLSPFCNVISLRDFFKKEDGDNFSFDQIQMEGNMVNTPYCKDDNERFSSREFWDSFVEYDNESDDKKYKKDKILEVFGVDISTDYVKEELYKKLLECNDSVNFKVHLYSPQVGNIYKITKSAGNVYLFEQVKREWDFYGSLCDYALFDLDQIDPVPPPQN